MNSVPAVDISGSIKSLTQPEIKFVCLFFRVNRIEA